MKYSRDGYGDAIRTPCSLPIIDGEAAPYPRPRTLAQEVEVQRRRCRPCTRCGGQGTAVYCYAGEWPHSGTRYAAKCGCAVVGYILFTNPAAARIHWNRRTVSPLRKLYRAFDALKERLESANEKLQRAEAHSAYLAELWTHLKAENVQLLMKMHGLAE